MERACWRSVFLTPCNSPLLLQLATLATLALRVARTTRFVVSETTGVADDLNFYRAGLVMVPADRLADTIKYYLARPAMRAAIAKRGHELFVSRSQAKLLQPAVRELSEAACGGPRGLMGERARGPSG